MQDLILFLGDYADPHKNLVAATIAWMAGERGVAFDVYYDAFRLGDHFGGGPIEAAEKGRAFGSTATGYPHMEAFHRLAAAYDCRIVTMDGAFFRPAVEALRLPVIAEGVDPVEIIRRTANFLDMPFPAKLLICGASSGEDAYLYPLIRLERAAAVHVSGVPGREAMQKVGAKKAAALLCTEKDLALLEARGIDPEVMAPYPRDDFQEFSRVLAREFSAWAEGYFLGDPIVTAYCLPLLLKEKRLALYAEPLTPLIDAGILAKLPENPVVYGRMHRDDDALEVSRLGGCWQLLDPGRPPFPAAAMKVPLQKAPEDFFELIVEDTDDAKLEEHAERGDILTSIVFWSGCLREMENFHRLFELIAVTGFRCGVAVTTDTFALGSASPFGLVTLPVDRGGVFPLVETLLASSGVGFSLESFLPEGAFAKHLSRAMERLRECAPEGVIPRGWWACLDTDLRQSPSPDKRLEGRPFGAYLPGDLHAGIYETLARHGFEYAVSKVSRAEVDPDGAGVTPLAQTAGRWQGWSPFHAIESIEDVKQAEKNIFTSGRPGYLLGSIDSCLWTFSLPQWERGRELKEMVEFILRGGRTGRLVNVHPYTVHRYAKLLGARGGEAPGGGIGMAAKWGVIRAKNAFKKIF